MIKLCSSLRSPCSKQPSLQGGDDRSLVFDCSYDGQDFDIEMVQLEDSKIPESEAYGGPNFM
jgi:hypothetical protein